MTGIWLEITETDNYVIHNRQALAWWLDMATDTEVWIPSMHVEGAHQDMQVSVEEFQSLVEQHGGEQ